MTRTGRAAGSSLVLTVLCAFSLSAQADVAEPNGNTRVDSYDFSRLRDVLHAEDTFAGKWAGERADEAPPLAAARPASPVGSRTEVDSYDFSRLREVLRREDSNR